MAQRDISFTREIYTVSKLTGEIKALLEKSYPFVWITGEISNFSKPVSGHYYFTLKDESAQISGVMFRGQNRQLKFEPASGMQVTGLGRINVYEPRGAYQIIFEFMEPKGVGALQVAYEQLKARLADEGLFDNIHKKPLPYLPGKIALITSPTGAVVHDMITVIHRRFPGVKIVLLPVKVQGDGASDEIAAALSLLNEDGTADVAILARGGGSIEDLQAFNDEGVARAIHASAIPVVAAVGHETDVTIADFVADLRAPTPSAAAELVVPLKHELARQVAGITNEIVSIFYRNIQQFRQRVEQMERRLVDPRKKVQDYRLRQDELTERLTRSILAQMDKHRERLDWRVERLHANIPLIRIENLKKTLGQLTDQLVSAYRISVLKREQTLRELAAKLNALSPLAILSRGYSITRTIPDAVVVRDPRQVENGQELEILLEKGPLRVNAMKN